MNWRAEARAGDGIGRFGRRQDSGQTVARASRAVEGLRGTRTRPRSAFRLLRYFACPSVVTDHSCSSGAQVARAIHYLRTALAIAVDTVTRVAQVLSCRCRSCCSCSGRCAIGCKRIRAK